MSMDFSPNIATSRVPLVRIFERIAELHSNKTAIRFENESLTYAQLNGGANRLAHGLLNNGISQGDRVIVCLPPSLEIVITILALHKIAAVYVPLDPGFPLNRIQAILDEVNPKIILDKGDSGKLPVGTDINYLDVSLAGLTDLTGENPNIDVSLNDHSHIFFTSGTTGKPKGVLANHANLLHYIGRAVERYGFHQNDRFIAAARFTFSISFFELLMPLAVGAELRILPREKVLDMAQLSAAVLNATVFHFGPSLLKQLLPYLEQHYSLDAFDHFHHVSSGGDMVPPEILESLKRLFRHADVFVIYGSSEISCMGCTFPAARTHTIERTRVGKPFEGVQVKILNEQLQPVGQNQVGQLYFAGNGLVTGYLNQPALTAEKFIDLDNQRFYAIGDVGRFDADGNIELLGRADFQVQIRGMRIELVEIEQYLKKLSVIKDCVLVAKKLSETADPSLVAYLVAQENADVRTNTLVEYLAQNLPDYMIPSVFVQLDKLPLNHNGKLDRSQLPQPSAENILLSNEFQAAQTSTQAELIELLQELFSVDSIGIDHSFFELGGDSLTAVRYLMAVDKKYGRFIPISYLLNHPSVRDLADVIDKQIPISGVGDVVVLKHGNTDAPLFCLYGVLLYRDLAMALDTPRTICGVFLEEEMLLLNPDTQTTELTDLMSVDKIAARYLHSITTFQAHGPYYLAGESFGGIIAMEVARLLLARGETVSLVAMLDSKAPGFWAYLTLRRRAYLHLKKFLRTPKSYLQEHIFGKLKQRLLRRKEGLIASVDNRADARATASGAYNPQIYKEPVVLFKAKERTEFEPESTDLGWGRYILQLTVHEVNGDHLSMLQQTFVQDLAMRLMPYL
jgi:amino acid adenylation domain-containing protein